MKKARVVYNRKTMGFRSAPVVIGVVESVLRIVCTIYLMKSQSEQLLCFVSLLIWTATALILIFMYIYWIKHLKRVLVKIAV